MKKIFTLIAMALMAVGANAQTEWRPEAGNVDGDVRLTARGDELIEVKTVFATTTGNLEVEGTPAPETFDGKTFNTYMQIRVDAAPTADIPTGTEKSGSSPLTIEAKKNVDLTIYYRRQTGDNAENDGKDMKLVDQANPGPAIAAAEYKTFTIDADYFNVKRVFKLDAGKKYTLWARGTTGRLYGFDYAEGTGSSTGGGGESSAVADGTYFISNTTAPTASNLTLDEMTNKGTANNVSTWDNGFSLMIMRSDKAYSDGGKITIDGTEYTSIKLSNGAQNKLTLPEGKVATGITIYSYQNTDAITDRDAYWKEIAGVTYETAADAGGLFASFKDGANPDKREYNFGENKLNVITFTNTGEQQCFVLKVDIVSGTATGIQSAKSATIDVNAPAYNLAGQKVDESFKGIITKNGKKMIQK